MCKAGSRLAGSDFRTLTKVEREVLKKLLSVDFPGHSILLLQLKNTRAQTIDAEGSIALLVIEGPSAAVSERVPVEGRYVDSDGVPVSVLLHVVNGYLHELEVYRNAPGVLSVALDPNLIELVDANYS